MSDGVTENLPDRTRQGLDRSPAAWSALLALILAAFLLRVLYLDGQSLWRDEVDVIRFANAPPAQLVRGLIQPQHNGPLYYVMMRGWLHLTGDSEFALRYPSLCFGLLTVPLVYQLGRRLLERRAALTAALLVAIAPYLVWYSQDAKMYALVTALTLLAMLCQLRALSTGRLRWWLAFVAVVSLSLYIHLLSALMIPVYAAFFLLTWPRFREQWRGWLVAYGALTLPYVPLALWQLPLMLTGHETGHPFYSLRQMVASLFNLYSRGVALVGDWWAVAVFVFAMLSGLVSAPEPMGDETCLAPASESAHLRVGGGLRLRLWLLTWLFLPLAFVYLISLRVPAFEPRYLVFVAPAFYLLTALGLVALSRRSWVAAGVTVALVLSLSLLGLWVQATTPIKSDFRAAAAYVMAHRRDEAPIMFQMPYIRHTFDYYFDGGYTPLEGPWTNDGKTEAQVGAMMRQLLEGESGLWLVASESWLWDSRDLTRIWLDRHARLVEAASFERVDVYHYELLKP